MKKPILSLMSLLACLSAIPALSPAARADGNAQAEFDRLRDRKIVQRLRAKDGVQIYACDATAPRHWKLREAKAELVDEKGKVVGKHLFIPNPNVPGALVPAWQLADGSAITGKKIANRPSTTAGAVDLLVMSVPANNGKGALARATDVERINTEGGQAPAAECSPGAPELRVPYQAAYVFFDKYTAAAQAPTGPGSPAESPDGGSHAGAAH